MDTNVLAIDLGASNGRGILYRFDGRSIFAHEIGRFQNAPIQIGSKLYWNIAMMYAEIQNMARTCVMNGIELSAISIDSWAQDFGLLSRGEPVSGVRCYRDPYTNSIFNKKEEFMNINEIFSNTGTAPFKGSTLYQLAAAKQQNPDLVSCADTLLFIPNLLSYFITGEISCDYTLASYSQIYDNYNNTWSKEIIKRFSLPDIFPRVDIPGKIIGVSDEYFNRQTGLRSVPIVLAAGHDTASAVYAASDEDRDHTIYLSSGTWSMFGVHMESPIMQLDMAAENKYSNAYGADGSRLALWGCSGLWTLQQCVKEWSASGYTVDYNELESFAMHHHTGAFFNISDDRIYNGTDMCRTVVELCRETGYEIANEPCEIYNVIINSLARKYEKSIRSFESLTGKTYDTIKIIGGGSKDKALNYLSAKYTGKKVITGPSEASSLGNALIQFKALGVLGDEQMLHIKRKGIL